ncbi:queuine tRNA-ribosyltransferase accessory subunit 2 [Thrips palmi]|uniref:Queuine tRNA-ribosyltransferase accessory subunit 2 n=1 Tax=Thrips palmi TaxID=161013 RepID=A0A6P8Y9T2_THRPL|nr:queuine tRNA-ribosyltransferase accessory subunit 2 [Thrips palmi]
MKFSVNHIRTSGRIGCLTGIDAIAGQTLPTPLLTVYTRGGNVPHITHDVLQMITSENLLMHMPLTTIFTSCTSIESFGKGLSEFVGLKEYPSYVTPQDPAVLTPSGYNEADKVAIWTKNGKRIVDPSRYMAMIESMKPNVYLSLCDGDTDSNSSKKRVSKCVSRSSHLLQECYRLHEASGVLKDSAFLAPIEGGYDTHARRAFLEELSKYDVFGYVLDGLHNNGPEVENIKFISVESIVTECLTHLPKEKLRVIHGAWNPVTLLQLVAAGFDMFDTSLPYLSTERGSAFTFLFNETMLASDQTPKGNSDGLWYEICLEDVSYKEVFEPISKDCECLACKNHTKAYIHHLLTSHELLGRVLLMIHNFHHYLEFFKSIRRAIENDSLDSLIALVQSQSPCT